MAESSRHARQVALDICTGVWLRGESLSRLLEQKTGKFEDSRERAFCSELCFGFCRYFYLLEQALESLLTRPLKKRDRDVAVVIMLGMLQLRFMRVSDHAAVNETVRLLKTLRKDWAKGLVNGVLRSYQRDLDKQPVSPAKVLQEVEQAQAYPSWIRQRIAEDWPDHAAKILAAGNVHASMVLRVDLTRISREDYLAQLSGLGILARQHASVESALVLDQGMAVSELPGFDSGLVSVQDAAAQLAAQLLDCGSGMRVLDACAAPGGKTLHLLQGTPDLDVVALDKEGERLVRVVENLARAGLRATTLCADAAHSEEWFNGEGFDRILLDAPCSASGIIRRHPDIRLLRRAGDIEHLAKQQQQILGSVWPLLKPDGILLYCTCSIFRQENEQRIEEFLHHTPDCVEVPLVSPEWGVNRPFGRQILPGLDDMDGFFYARLRKKQ